MSERLPAVKPKELIRALEQKGWQLDRVRGSHHILVHTEQRRALPVPVHNRELKAGRHTDQHSPYRWDQPR